MVFPLFIVRVWNKLSSATYIYTTFPFAAITMPTGNFNKYRSVHGLAKVDYNVSFQFGMLNVMCPWQRGFELQSIFRVFAQVL